MDLGLRGKRALVTGSTGGIGWATAHGLAAEGAAIVINGRTPERVEAAVARMRESLPDAIVDGIAADLGTAAGCACLIERLPQVDVLVNNLGIIGMQRFEDVGDDEWLHMFEVNVMSGIRLSRHYLAGMRQRDWGRVVFVSSESGLQVPADMLHYSVTKTAQLTVARGLAEMLAGTGVTVNSVLPGPTVSEGVGRFLSRMAAKQQLDIEQVKKEFLGRMGPTSVIRRFASPEEIAAMIVYVCSARASATTGAALRVDGGMIRAVM
jgi:NAD(P)-dependent dehydrogenase (short-subunit alcohol dehydrogenase family)